MLYSYITDIIKLIILPRLGWFSYALLLEGVFLVLMSKTSKCVQRLRYLLLLILQLLLMHYFLFLSKILSVYKRVAGKTIIGAGF